MRFTKRCVTLVIICVILIQLVWYYTSEKQSYRSFKQVNLPKAKNKTLSGLWPGKIDIPILLWWDSVYTDVDEIRHCGENKCRLTNKREFQNHHDTSAFLFYGSNFKPYNLPLPRKPHHLWALMHEESPRNAYILLHEPALSIFNFTSTYSMQSDYPITTQWLQCPEWLQDKKYVLPLVDKNRLRKLGLAPVLYLQSDCDVPSDRDSFVKVLQKHIPVDSYGTCLQNKKMARRLRFHDNMAPLDDQEFFRFAARYKFALAMENYVCEDYITEKLWRPLRLGSVPIVFGAPNIKEYLPSNNSAIVIEDYEDVEDLVQYIRLLDTNDKLYKQYMTFKDGPLENLKLKQILQSRDWAPDFCSKSIPKFMDHQNKLYNSIFTGYECFVCDKVHEYIKSGGKTVFKVNASDYKCPSPRRFDESGHYSIHKDTWAAEWNFGKHEAIAMLLLYESGKTMSQKEFYKFVKKTMNSDY
ncbi:alpha-(1,3)-fucosyltransferase 10-like isoform X2 [Mercenaria mercenaria]|uniref:alpha-(1,3)-fucosyltransferase 10-like isoform X2 n=1 Tax=Mercenaria mercenaria TaxID=6596 RepID=UPI00234F22D5|nr:alpha-(1,3)-fucosyltransferase 10-like isoform X2 [Mercenaria mercenaria]